MLQACESERADMQRQLDQAAAALKQSRCKAADAQAEAIIQTRQANVWEQLLHRANEAICNAKQELQPIATP